MLYLSKEGFVKDVYMKKNFILSIVQMLYGRIWGGILVKVLMVEDEELTREGLRRSIPWESLGITEVHMAEDGEEGLHKALELQPDIIMADVRMPRMDGITMAFEIRKTWKQCRFIL